MATGPNRGALLLLGRLRATRARLKCVRKSAIWPDCNGEHEASFESRNIAMIVNLGVPGISAIPRARP